MKMSYSNTCFRAHDEYMKCFPSIWFQLVFFTLCIFHCSHTNPLRVYFACTWSGLVHKQKPSVWFFYFSFLFFLSGKLILIFFFFVCWIGLLLMPLFDVGTFPLIYAAHSLPLFLHISQLVWFASVSALESGTKTDPKRENHTCDEWQWNWYSIQRFFPLIFSCLCCPHFFPTNPYCTTQKKSVTQQKTRKTTFHYTYSNIVDVFVCATVCLYFYVRSNTPKIWNKYICGTMALCGKMKWKKKLKKSKSKCRQNSSVSYQKKPRIIRTLFFAKWNYDWGKNK